MLEITLAEIRKLHKIRNAVEFKKFSDNGYLKTLQIKYHRYGFLTGDGYMLLPSSINVGHPTIPVRKYQYHVINPKGVTFTKDLGFYDSMKECISNIETLIKRGIYK